MDYLIKMVNGGIIDVKSEESFSDGCETCDYGSEYCQELIVIMTHLTVSIKSTMMYKYFMTLSDAILLFTKNISTIEQLKERDFAEWAKKEIDKLNAKNERRKAIIEINILNKQEVS